MATPFVKESKRHQPLEIHDFHKILTLLERHGFSSHRYYDLGLYLGLHSHTLHDIRNNCREDGDRCLRECLIAWLQQRDDVMTGGQTYDALIQVLREMEENAVADGIERYIRVIDSPPKERHTVQPGELGIQDLVEILDLLKEHGYSGVRYYDLGLYLGLTHHTLHDIQNEYYGDFDRCLAECLEAWLKRKDNVDSVGGPTYDTLIQALRKMGENAVADGIERDLRGHIVPPTANPISTKDTPAADRIPDTQNPPTERKIEEWLKEGEVKLKVTRINMHGAPGAGKTCSQHLLLNEPPPEKLTDSTPIACPAVQATRISIDDENKKWERVNIEDLYKQLASHLEDETENEKMSTEGDEASMSEIDDMSEDDNVSDSSDESLMEESIATEPHTNEPVRNEQTAEKQQTKNIPAENKPIKTEVIQKVTNVQETQKFNTNWVYFIDSGGQPAYRELLPLFTRGAALNIITVDLTKGLDEKCEFHYRLEQHEFPIKTKLEYSNRDIIRSTISSEAMLNPVKISYVSHMPEHSHYLILGTRKDELEKREKLGELNKMNKLLLEEYKDNRKVIPRNKRHIIFPVNTLLPAGSKEREEASASLCKVISNCRVEMTIELPIRLLAFEIALKLEAKKKERSFLTREEVIEIGRSLRLDDESDIDDALEYLHNVTIIFYYQNVLPNFIFTNPKPILDVLSHLIAVTYIDHTDLHLLAEPPPSPDETYNLIKFGLFKEDIFKNIGMKLKVFNKDFQPSHMIALLKHLHIIAEVENREEGDYFFLCALPSCDIDKLNRPPPEIHVQPLLIAWEIDNSGTTTLAIPQGLFPLTIVHLLEKKDTVQFAPGPDSGSDSDSSSDSSSDSGDKTGFYRYNDAISLRIYKEYTIDIINRYTHIEIHLDDHSKEFCLKIRELVTDAIKKSSDDLKVSKKHIFAFKCPRKNRQCYCIVKEDNSSTRCTQCRLHRKVLQGDDNSYRCWFSDYQSSSPGTKASSEDPPTKRRRLESSTSTGTLPVQPHQDSTTVNPDSDHGAGQLGIEDLDKVLTVLQEAMFGSAEWNNLGLKLGLLGPTTLDVIEDGGGNAHKKLKKTIKAWLRGEDKQRQLSNGGLIGSFTTKPANVFLVHGWDFTRYLELLECYLMQLVMVVFSYSIVKVAGVAQEDSSTNKRPSCYYFKRI
uniref:Death domain-containing protein n=1 Tax=Amphimedon queenslandica TaxID=400682 RepID=A0A1X7TKU7_AMPQE